MICRRQALLTSCIYPLELEAAPSSRRTSARQKTERRAKTSIRKRPPPPRPTTDASEEADPFEEAEPGEYAPVLDPMPLPQSDKNKNLARWAAVVDP